MLYSTVDVRIFACSTCIIDLGPVFQKLVNLKAGVNTVLT